MCVLCDWLQYYFGFGFTTLNLKPLYFNVISIEHTASAEFVAFWLVLPFGEIENVIHVRCSLKHNCIVFTIFQPKILFKISVLDLLVKYS